jgi:hypothetical protein
MFERDKGGWLLRREGNKARWAEGTEREEALDELMG